MGKNQDVLPNSNGGWDVHGEGNSRATVHTDTKIEAIKKARQISQNQHSELIIHNRDGKIAQKDSHGHDPNPPKDKD
ncbi:conserved hypothetical protein [Oenococcus oeni]|uniref:DUF2188 domain-containing protein n=1 Tax=Oenococcus oeni TaxID=1247 RepID=UPI0010B6FAAE|nr:DUF2188 domain-containing protein [Oenococcus oeni]SYW00387.1 conserved hypothetical protein [Oenococcus oeni]SYW07243.1 conserved hypothetical protein [Oenococcus oeni]